MQEIRSFNLFKKLPMCEKQKKELFSNNFTGQYICSPPPPSKEKKLTIERKTGKTSQGSGRRMISGGRGSRKEAFVQHPYTPFSPQLAFSLLRRRIGPKYNKGPTGKICLLIQITSSQQLTYILIIHGCGGLVLPQQRLASFS